MSFDVRPWLASIALASTLACETSSSGSEGEAGGTMESGDGDTTSDTQTGDGDGDGDGDAACTPDLETLRAEIFTPGCALASCHASADAAGGLDLETADLEAELVGAASGTCDGWVRVVPGAPDESLLYAKISGAAPCGDPMPPPAGLPDDQVACVRSWIENVEGVSCETCGGDACIDLETDNQNCGACGNACPAGVACVAGACECPAGQELCDGACIDIMADPQNCGACGSACAQAKVCWEGVCADTCADLSDCDGSCVDLDTNPLHCGACNNACAQGSACEMGGCDCPGDGVSFAAEIEPVLADACTGFGCHAFPAPAAGLDLTAGNSYDSLVGVLGSQCGDRMLVAPGQPGNSYLLDKLQGVNLCFGTQMPKAAPPLSAQQIDTISEWICRGASNN